MSPANADKMLAEFIDAMRGIITEQTQRAGSEMDAQAIRTAVFSVLVTIDGMSGSLDRTCRLTVGNRVITNGVMLHDALYDGWHAPSFSPASRRFHEKMNAAAKEHAEELAKDVAT